MSNFEEKFKRILNLTKKKIKYIMDKSEMPGFAITIVSKDKPIWFETFGFTDLTKKYKINLDTLFSIQSSTKTYTAVAFLLAMQKGLVNLDEPIVKYYPEFYINSREEKEEYKKITFRHLLTHTSGLPREARKGGCFSHIVPTWEEHIKSLNDSWMNNTIGSRFDYSNIGMDLVAYILERIVNMPYYNYLQEVLGNPL